MSVRGGFGQHWPLVERNDTHLPHRKSQSEWTTPEGCPELWGEQVGMQSLLKSWLVY